MRKTAGPKKLPSTRQPHRAPHPSTTGEVIESFRLASIEEAAMAVVCRKGLAEMTIQSVADEAGIAKGTVYLYFHNRDDLVAKTAKRAYDAIVKDAEAAFSSSGTLEQRLTRIVLRPLELIEEREGLVVAALAFTGSDASPQASRSRLHAWYLQRLETFFTEARRRGETRDVDPSVVASMVLDCIRGSLVRRLDRPASPPRASEAALIVSQILHGIASSGK